MPTIPNNATFTLHVYEPPTARLIGGGNFCIGDNASAVKMVGVYGLRPYTFNYTDAAGNAKTAVSAPSSDTAFLAVPSTAGNYVYQLSKVTDSAGCQSFVPNLVASATAIAKPSISLSTSYVAYCNTPVALTASGGFNQ